MEVSGQHHIPAAFTTGKKTSTQWNGGRVDPRAGLDVSEKEKTLIHAENGTADSPARSTVDIPTVARRTTLTYSHQKSTEGQ